MKHLTERQARECENSKIPRCRCRCRGTAHGASRIPADAQRKMYEELPEDDPHHLKQRKRDKERLRTCYGCGAEIPSEFPAGPFCPAGTGCSLRGGKET